MTCNWGAIQDGDRLLSYPANACMETHTGSARIECSDASSNATALWKRFETSSDCSGPGEALDNFFVVEHVCHATHSCHRGEFTKKAGCDSAPTVDDDSTVFASGACLRGTKITCEGKTVTIAVYEHQDCEGSPSATESVSDGGCSSNDERFQVACEVSSSQSAFRGWISALLLAMMIVNTTSFY